MANIPIIAIGNYDNISPAISSGTLSYPAFIITTDDNHYNRLMFLQKDNTLLVIEGSTSGGGTSSYNELVDIPIINKSGTVFNPIVLSELNDGMYSITGSYQYTDNETTYVTPNSTLFIVGTDNYGNKCVTKYGFNGIEIYYIDSETGALFTDGYVTESWIDENIVPIDTDSIKKLFD